MLVFWHNDARSSHWHIRITGVTSLLFILLFSGRLCLLLWTHWYGYHGNICWKSCVQNTLGQTSSKGQGNVGNLRLPLIMLPKYVTGYAYNPHYSTTDSRTRFIRQHKYFCSLRSQSISLSIVFITNLTLFVVYNLPYLWMIWYSWSMIVLENWDRKSVV